MAKECEPKYLFLENSHVLSRKENLDVVVSAFSELGYDCRWITCHATCVGAPHQRHRWFCIVSKRDVDLDIKIPHVEPFDWERNEPERQVEKNTPENNRISKWLGNAVVPDQVRFAFTQLVTMETTFSKKTARKIIQCGYSTNKDIIFSKNIVFQTRQPLNIELRQETMPGKHNATTPHVNFCIRRFWSTPTFTGPFTGTRVLTFRSSRLLSSQVIFSNGKPGWCLNCDWLTWLMGYEPSYFKQ